MRETSPPFPRFFNAEEIGRSLREVATDLMQSAEANIVSRWFHSEKDADLFIWTDEKRGVIKQQLSFFGQVIEWNAVEGVRTGLIVESDTHTAMDRSEVVRFDSKAQRGPIEQAIACLRHVPNLSASERAVLEGNFRSSARPQPMAAAEFTERFGAYLETPRLRAERPVWWRRWLAWLRR